MPLILMSDLFADDILFFMSSKEAHTLEYKANLEIGKMPSVATRK